MLYTDPGTGSLVLQVAFAVLATAAIFMKRWWAIIVGGIRRGFAKFRRSR
jgi:hypothetical protein